MCNNPCQQKCLIAHIFTAAHCIKFKNQPEVKAESIVLYVGKHNLQEWTERNSQARDVSQWGQW